MTSRVIHRQDHFYSRIVAHPYPILPEGVYWTYRHIVLTYSLLQTQIIQKEFYLYRRTMILFTKSGWQEALLWRENHFIKLYFASIFYCSSRGYADSIASIRSQQVRRHA